MWTGFAREQLTTKTPTDTKTDGITELRPRRRERRILSCLFPLRCGHGSRDWSWALDWLPWPQRSNGDDDRTDLSSYGEAQAVRQSPSRGQPFERHPFAPDRRSRLAVAKVVRGFAAREVARLSSIRGGTHPPPLGAAPSWQGRAWANATQAHLARPARPHARHGFSSARPHP